MKAKILLFELWEGLFRNAKFIFLCSFILSIVPLSFYLALYVKTGVFAIHHVLFFYLFSVVISTLQVVAFEDEFEKPRMQGELAFRVLLFLLLIFIFSVLIEYSTAVFFIKSHLLSYIFSGFMIFMSILLDVSIIAFIVTMSYDKLYVFLYNKFESFYIFFNKRII